MALPFSMFLTQSTQIAGRSTGSMIGGAVGTPPSGPGITEPRWPQSASGSPLGERADPWAIADGNVSPEDVERAVGIYNRVVTAGSPEALTNAVNAVDDAVDAASSWLDFQRVAFLGLGAVMLFIGLTQVAKSSGADETVGRGLATLRNEDYVRRPTPAEREKQRAARRARDTTGD